MEMEMEFNWGNFKNGKIGVNCHTKEEAEKFIDMCYNNGICWYNDNGNEGTYWLEYKENTCYSCMNGKLVYSNETNYIKIYKFKDITNDNKMELKKGMELKEGMIIECRNGCRYLLRQVNGELIGSNNNRYIDLQYNEDYDIMKIYISDAFVLSKVFNDEYLDCIWERKEPKKMTLAQISKELGYEVEVVDNE